MEPKQGRQDSNLQPPVLETGALPIELLPYGKAHCRSGRPGLALHSSRWPGRSDPRSGCSSSSSPAASGAWPPTRRSNGRGSSRSPRPCSPSGWVSFPIVLSVEARILDAVAQVEDVETLWAQYKSEPDRQIRDRLILTYAPLVKYVAGKLGAGLPAHVDESDLVSYGLLGLIDAIERYDLDRDVKFETYAVARIRGAIIDELRSLDWVPRSVRSRAREIERAIAQLEAQLMRAPTDEEIAAKMGVSEEELDDALLEISRSSIGALDELWSSPTGSGDAVTLVESLEDPNTVEPGGEIEATEVREMIGEAIAALPGAGEARHHALLLRGADLARDRRGARSDRVPRLAAPHEGDPAPQGASRGCRGARHDGAIGLRGSPAPHRRPTLPQPAGNGRSDARGELHSFGRREPRGRNVRPCQRTIRAPFATSPSSVIAGPERRHSSRRCSSSRGPRTGWERWSRARRSPTGTRTSTSARCRCRLRCATSSGAGRRST